MIGEIGYHDDTSEIRNEISYSNLIALASNQEILDSLDPETRKNLIGVLCGYTKACVDFIMNGDNEYYYGREARVIQSNMPKK